MEIAIAGAGLVGRLLAWLLAREQHRVTLFDQDSGDGQMSAGFIAAAMLAPCSEVVNADPRVYEQGLFALKQWPRWLKTLEQDSGIKVDYQQRGGLVVAHPADRADLTWFYHKLQNREQVSREHFQWLEGAEITRLEPELAGFSEAVYLPCEGCLDNRALFRALHDAALSLGVNWQSGHEVISVVPGQITTRAGKGKPTWRTFEQVLDCRGFGGKPQLQNLRGVRGEVLWVKAPEVSLTRPVRLMHPRYQLYVAPRPGNLYVIGATEIESESLKPITVRSCLELQSALYSVHTGFAEAQLLEARSHCRPAFPDNLPRIYQANGLIRVNGLYRHGYLLGPGVVMRALGLISKSNPYGKKLGNSDIAAVLEEL